MLPPRATAILEEEGRARTTHILHSRRGGQVGAYRNGRPRLRRARPSANSCPSSNAALTAGRQRQSAAAACLGGTQQGVQHGCDGSCVVAAGCCARVCRHAPCMESASLPRGSQRPALTAQQVGSLVGMPPCGQAYQPVERATMQALDLRSRTARQAGQPILR